MFRRREQRIFRGMQGTPNVPPMLQHANQLMANGEYASASTAFQELAQRAEERRPQRAPLLYIEAGRAAILSKQTQAGLAHVKHGLNLFATQGRAHRMQAVGQRVIDELKAHHLNAESEKISLLLRGVLPKEIPTPQSASAIKRPILPTHCPACGAAVRSDDVEWLDEVTAECDYCGSPVRAEA